MMKAKKKIVKLVLPCVLSCLMMGSALLHFPVQQSSAETVMESADLEKVEDTLKEKTSFQTSFWLGIGAVTLGGVVALIVVKKKKDDEGE